MQDPIKCSNGTYRDTEGAGSDMDCIDCALGQYCLSEGLTEPTGPCQPGFYCLRGNVEPTPTGTIIDLEFHYGFEVWQNVLYYDPDIIRNFLKYHFSEGELSTFLFCWDLSFLLL